MCRAREDWEAAEPRGEANFVEVFHELMRLDRDVLLAPMGCVSKIERTKKGGRVTINVAPDMIEGLLALRYAGGLIVADKDEFRAAELKLNARGR